MVYLQCTAKLLQRVERDLKKKGHLATTLLYSKDTSLESTDEVNPQQTSCGDESLEFFHGISSFDSTKEQIEYLKAGKAMDMEYPDHQLLSLMQYFERDLKSKGQVGVTLV